MFVPSSPEGSIQPKPLSPTNSITSSARPLQNKRRHSEISETEPNPSTSTTTEEVSDSKRTKTQVRDLTAVIVLPISPAVPAPSAGADPSWYRRLWGKSEPWVVTREIVLNDSGQVYILLRDPDATSGDKIPALNLRCSEPTLRALATSSKWAQILPSTKKNPKVLMPEEDDVVAMLFILRVAHRVTEDVPQELSTDQVTKIATVCHKYSMMGMIRKAVIDRFQDLHEFERLNGNPDNDQDVKKDKNGAEHEFLLQPGNESWLFVAWTFGLEHSFKRLLKHLIHTCLACTGTKGQLLNAKGQALTGCFPAAVIDYIKETREFYLRSILDLVYRYAGELLLPGKYFPATQESQLKYAHEICGKFYIELKTLGLPLAQPGIEAVGSLSIEKLVAHIKNDEGSRVLEEMYGHTTDSGSEGDNLESIHQGDIFTREPMRKRTKQRVKVTASPAPFHKNGRFQLPPSPLPFEEPSRSDAKDHALGIPTSNP